jgi:hypothetical protein
LEGLILNEIEQKEQFQELLYLYVNGRLEEDKRSWIDKYIAEHPSAAAELQIENVLKESLSVELPSFAADHGLDIFMSRIRSESPPPKTSAFTESCKRFMQRCQKSIGSIYLNPGWAVAVTLLIAQSGLIGALLTHRTAPIFSTQAEWRSVNDTPQSHGPVLLISFKSSATEEEIRFLLVTIRGSFVGGPGQLGNYMVKVPDDSIDEAKKQVINSTIVESVNILQELPVEH